MNCCSRDIEPAAITHNRYRNKVLKTDDEIKMLVIQEKQMWSSSEQKDNN